MNATATAHRPTVTETTPRPELAARHLAAEMLRIGRPARVAICPDSGAWLVILDAGIVVRYSQPDPNAFRI